MSNPVAKNCRKFNKAKCYIDRKKRSKKGYKKHAKGGLHNLPFSV